MKLNTEIKLPCGATIKVTESDADHVDLLIHSESTGFASVGKTDWEVDYSNPFLRLCIHRSNLKKLRKLLDELISGK